jgi:hypothetical protein
VAVTKTHRRTPHTSPAPARGERVMFHQSIREARRRSLGGGGGIARRWVGAALGQAYGQRCVASYIHLPSMCMTRFMM